MLPESSPVPKPSCSRSSLLWLSPCCVHTCTLVHTVLTRACVQARVRTHTHTRLVCFSLPGDSWDLSPSSISRPAQANLKEDLGPLWTAAPHPHLILLLQSYLGSQSRSHTMEYKAGSSRVTLEELLPAWFFHLPPTATQTQKPLGIPACRDSPQLPLSVLWTSGLPCPVLLPQWQGERRDTSLKAPQVYTSHTLPKDSDRLRDSLKVTQAGTGSVRIWTQVCKKPDVLVSYGPGCILYFAYSKNVCDSEPTIWKRSLRSSPGELA